jgi:hypothetical protein
MGVAGLLVGCWSVFLPPSVVLLFYVCAWGGCAQWQLA